MPATTPLPTVGDFLDAFGEAVSGEEGPSFEARRGGTLDLVGGSSALLWTAVAARDRGNFRGCYIETARGDDLARIGARRYGTTPTEASYGTGTLVLARPSAVAGEGSIDAGTRIKLGGVELYAVATDAPVLAADLVVQVQVRALRYGTGVAVSTSTGLALGDTLFDPTFVPVSLVCAEGTEDEDPAAFVARGRAARKLLRSGYRRAIERACLAAGAVNVVALDASAFGSEADIGLSKVYVGDAAYASPDALLDACMVALEDARVAGCDLEVRGMTATPVALTVVAKLWKGQVGFDLTAIRGAILGALLDAFDGRKDFWLFDVDSLGGTAGAAAPWAVQSVTVTSDPAPPAATFPASLPRYTLSGADVVITFLDPS